KNILFTLPVTYPVGLTIGVIRYLEVILTRSADKPKLIVRVDVKNERGKCSPTRHLVMQNLARRRRETIIAAVAVDAEIISAPVIVVANAQLVVGRVIGSVAGDQLCLAAALETGTRDHVENSIGAITEFGRISPALDLYVVH